jgi:hypothetical protein
MIKWDKCQENMIEGTSKRKPKTDVCHFTIVLEVLFQKWFPSRAKSQKKNKHAKQPQEDKRRRDSPRERFIKNTRPLNPTHISPKKDKDNQKNSFDVLV